MPSKLRTLALTIMLGAFALGATACSGADPKPDAMPETMPDSKPAEDGADKKPAGEETPAGDEEETEGGGEHPSGEHPSGEHPQ